MWRTVTSQLENVISVQSAWLGRARFVFTPDAADFLRRVADGVENVVAIQNGAESVGLFPVSFTISMCAGNVDVTRKKIAWVRQPHWNSLDIQNTHTHTDTKNYRSNEPYPEGSNREKKKKSRTRK